MASHEAVLEQARAYVKSELERDSSGHDWWHIVRVARTAKLLAEMEQADVFVCELAALLHDIADEKLNASKEAGLGKLEAWLREAGVEHVVRKHILDIVSAISFAGGNEEPPATLEGRIVQDADRLDAMGAVGIARAFAYAGWKGHLIYDPKLPPRERMTKGQYRSGISTAVNHFYEKLLKLKGLMNTESARVLAGKRHQFMELYLREFDKEWELGNEAYLEESAVFHGEISRVHIAFGDSAGGSLRQALRGFPGEMVVTLNDDLMFGPLSEAGAAGGLSRRVAWWRERVSELDRDEAVEYLLQAAFAWRDWPARLRGLPVVVWASDSAAEQTGLRRLLAALPEDADVSLVNAADLLRRRVKEIVYQSTGEIVSEKLAPLLSEAKPLLPEEREAYAADWRRLVAEGGVLRVWEGGKLRTVPEDYFDEAILKAARKLAAANGTYVKAARLIGEVIGHSEQKVDDGFIEYRVRKLIARGLFTYTGELKAMRYYSVSLAEDEPDFAEDGQNI